jgi:Flp pilus assembly pilin Flp
MDSPVMRLAKSSAAIEQGLLVAGVTVTGVAVLQTLGIMLFWLLSVGT